MNNRSMLFVFAAMVAMASSARGEILPKLSIRHLTIEADAIVIGEPLEAVKGIDPPETYKIVEVLVGPELLLGDKVKLQLGRYTLAHGPLVLEAGGAPPDLHEVKQVLLFLKGFTVRQYAEYEPLPLGIRALTKRDRVLAPRQIVNPGPRYLLFDDESQWEAILAQIKRDLPTIMTLQELAAIEDKAKRNQAFLAWLEKHREEFGEKNRPDFGWGKYERALFRSIIRGGKPDDLWVGMELAHELRGWRLEGSFASAAGRKLLLEKVFDEDLSDKLRFIALESLGEKSNYWVVGKTQDSCVVSVQEQQEIIDRLIPLLKHRDPLWRMRAVGALHAISWPTDAPLKMISRRAIPQLVETYQTDEHVGVRSVAADAIRRLESEAFWQKISRKAPTDEK